jgi:outer membrane receptor for ferrienterochelin and colicins
LPLAQTLISQLHTAVPGRFEMLHSMRIRSRIGIMTVTAVVVAYFLMSPAAAGTLSGRVVDKNNGNPLVGATVRLRPLDHPGKSIGVAADRDGRFQFSDIPAGTYSAMISAIGFTPESISEIAIPESGSKILDISLASVSINLHSVSVTASRRPEKILDAPASVSVVESEEIEARNTLTPTEYVKGLPGVDVATLGLNQSTMVVRGFNNIFSGALLVLTDNRIASVPSLRFNAYNFIPTTDEDIDRVEIVSGPGSALYGPNAACGVMHIITKSPFVDQGTSVSLGGGQRDLLLGSFRHAQSVGKHIGFKVTGQYYQGHDWESHDPSEPDSIQKFRPTASGRIPVGDTIPNNRNFHIKKLAGEARVDFLIAHDATLILNGGLNQASSIELTGLGAAQGIDWTYSYVQARFRLKQLFAQAYVNMSDAGDTYLLPTGQLIIDNSKFWAFQLQHQYMPRHNWTLTYGSDVFLTRPETDSTINGRNETHDNVNEVGGYVQSELSLTKQLSLIGALRLDKHNRLENAVVSPRAALVYQPNDDNNFRFTYNRAFSTPEVNDLSLDLLQTADLGGIGALLEPSLGFRPEIDIRVEGVPETGFHWSYDENGPRYRSPFAPLDTIRNLTPNDYISFNDTLFTNTIWHVGREQVMNEVENKLSGLVQSGLIDQATMDAAMAAIDDVTPRNISGVGNRLMTLNPDDQAFQPSSVSDIADIERLKPTITQTLELGYKGLLGDRLQFSVDVYRTEKNNFIGYLAVETPNVFLDSASLSDYLQQVIQDSLDANPAYDSILTPIDNPYFPIIHGNGNGTPADEISSVFSSGASALPFGTVTPEEALDPTAILVTYRNFGDISFYGADLSATYHVHSNWNIGAAYSYISKNFFAKSAKQVHDIYLNAPRHKAGLSLQYINRRWGLDAIARYRFVDAFDVASPFYGKSVKAYHIVDFTSAVGFFYNSKFVLTVQNIFNKRHIEFIGGPKIGRLIIARITRMF